MEMNVKFLIFLFSPLPNVSLIMVTMSQLKFDLAVGINVCAQHHGFYYILSLSHNKLYVLYFGLSCWKFMLVMLNYFRNTNKVL